MAAQAYIIVDSKTGYVLQEHKSKEKRQVGSLTKIAMAMVVLDWAEKHSGDLESNGDDSAGSIYRRERKPDRFSAG